MAATSRLIVMMEPAEKAAIEARAEAARVSTAEFVRRRLFGRAGPEEEAFLGTLAGLKPLVRRAYKTIDANLADIRRLRESSRQRDAEVARNARAELTRSELASVARRLEAVSGSAPAGAGATHAPSGAARGQRAPSRTARPRGERP